MIKLNKKQKERFKQIFKYLKSEKNLSAGYCYDDYKILNYSDKYKIWYCKDLNKDLKPVKTYYIKEKEAIEKIKKSLIDYNE